MANIDLKFLCTFDSRDYIQTEMQHVEDDENLICIKIKDLDNSCAVMLDKSTAIKFAKTLRTEINKIKEVNNV